MSENPTTDIDLELSAVTRSFSQSLSRVMMNSTRTRSGTPVRQTKPATRRQLSQLSTGKLTKLMYTTFTRGAHGADVVGESRRLSSELMRRGLHRTATTWDQMVTHLGKTAPGSPGRGDVAQPQRAPSMTATASPARTGQPAVQAGGDMVVDRSSTTPPPVPDQPPAQKPVQESAKRDTATSTGHTVSPGVSAALGAVVAAGTLFAVDELATAVDERIDQLGVAPLQSRGPDGSAEFPSDAEYLAGSPEAANAAGFGAGAVVGEVGQALADQADSPGGGTAATPGEDLSQQNAPAPTPNPAAGMEV